MAAFLCSFDKAVMKSLHADIAENEHCRGASGEEGEGGGWRRTFVRRVWPMSTCPAAIIGEIHSAMELVVNS